jgi:hypothetical protein
MIHPAPARHVDFDVASLGPCLAVSGHGGARVGSGPKRGLAEAPSAMVGGKESAHDLVDVWLAHGLATLAA